MTGEPIVTVIGNLTADPELRFTPSGAAVLNGTIASTPRSFDKQSNEWKDDETLFVRFALWREAAENGVESLHKGDRVIAHGKWKARSYETKDGEKRTSNELEVEELGPSLKYATATVTRNGRGARAGNSQSQGFAPPQSDSFGGQGGFGGGQQGFGSPSQPPAWEQDDNTPPF